MGYSNITQSFHRGLRQLHSGFTMIVDVPGRVILSCHLLFQDTGNPGIMK